MVLFISVNVGINSLIINNNEKHLFFFSKSPSLYGERSFQAFSIKRSKSIDGAHRMSNFKWLFFDIKLAAISFN